MEIQIRKAAASELDVALAVERAAFESDEAAEIASALAGDPTAIPALSLLAWEGDRAIGHILFTTAQLTENQNNANISLLAPLAVVPDMQRKGVGTRLIQHGLQQLSQAGVDLVFVLGYPEYYPRHGFRPAKALGFETPQPILEEQIPAWMVRELRPGIIGKVTGKVICADALNHPDLWQE